MIPEHCIEKFQERFKSYPSIIEVGSRQIRLDISKIFSKSLLIWSYDYIESSKLTNREKFIEYDSTGIMIYINDSKDIFILTTSDKKNVAEFLIHTLTK